MTQALASQFTVTHSCGCSRTLEARPREAAQTKRWMSQVLCPVCADKQAKEAEKAANDLAKVQLVQMGVKQLGDSVFTAPSETEEQSHIVTVDEQGQANYCSCKWFKYGKWSIKKCKHGLAVEAYIQEEQEGQALIASRKAWLAERKAEIAQAVA